jgi:hypothetical protein
MALQENPTTSRSNAFVNLPIGKAQIFDNKSGATDSGWNAFETTVQKLTDSKIIPDVSFAPAHFELHLKLTKSNFVWPLPLEMSPPKNREIYHRTCEKRPTLVRCGRFLGVWGVTFPAETVIVQEQNSKTVTCSI